MYCTVILTSSQNTQMIDPYTLNYYSANLGLVAAVNTTLPIATTGAKPNLYS